MFASDPSVSACSRTFRGDIGTTSELIATFHFAENDALACPVSMPVGSLSRPTIQDDYITLQSVLSGIASDSTEIVAVVAPDWAPPHPSGFDLLLQRSAAEAVTLTATSSCVAAGMHLALFFLMHRTIFSSMLCSAALFLHAASLETLHLICP